MYGETNGNSGAQNKSLFANDSIKWDRENKLSAQMFHYSPLGMAVAGGDGCFLGVNNKLCEMLGYDQKEFAEIQLRNLFDQEGWLFMEEQMKRSINLPVCLLPDIRLVCKDKTIIWGSVTLSAVLDKDGIPECFLFQINMEKKGGQVTFNQNANHMEKENYYELIVETCLDAIEITGLNGELTHVNAAFQRLYGFQADEILGRKSPYGEYQLENMGYSSYCDSAKGQIIETIRLRKDLTPIHVSLNVVPLYAEDGRLMAVAGITKDSSERIRMEQSIKESEEKYRILADNTSHLMSERNRTEEMLRQSDKLSLVGQLAAGIAHEIRNPLTSLKGFVKFMQSGAESKDEYFTIMFGELHRIEIILNELLMLAKPQVMTLTKRVVGHIVQDVIALLETQANMRNIEFVVRLDACQNLIECEENKIKQVFINILKNAMEAMAEGGKIIISGMVRGKEVSIQFRDEGLGISTESLPRLGEPFFSTKEQGTGLGLMVSQKIIHEHKGNILIHSILDKGTTVEVLLPVCD